MLLITICDRLWHPPVFHLQGYEGEYSIYVQPTLRVTNATLASLPPIFRGRFLTTFPVSTQGSPGYTQGTPEYTRVHRVTPGRT